MTFELAGLDQGNNSPDEASLALSLEANESPRLAQATDTDARAEQTESGLDKRLITEFTSLPKEGRLGWMMSDDSPSTMIRSLSESDQAWKEPYKSLTEMDGHRLLGKYDGAMGVIRNELINLPSLDSHEAQNLSAQYIEGGITPELEAKIAKYPQIQLASQAAREALQDPNYIPARELQKQVRENLVDGYHKRQHFAEMFAGDEYVGGNIPGTDFGAAASVIAFSMERHSLSTYFYEPIFDSRYQD